jgi:Family of unknown function (DUF6069)
MTTTTTHHDVQTTGPVWRRVALGGVAGWLAATAAVEVYAALGRAVGLSMRAGAPAAHTAQPVTAANFALGVFICTFWGTMLALVIVKVTSRPTRTFTLTTILLTTMSLASPLAAAHTAGSMKLFLACGHLLAAAIVIPILARQFPRTGRKVAPRLGKR